MKPHTFLLSEYERHFDVLIAAGIEEDKAHEVAWDSAVATADKKFKLGGVIPIDDDFETSPNVYGA
jgi:hypothetical protein